MVYNVSEGDMAMLRVVLNTTIDQAITVFLLTQDGSAMGKLCSIRLFPPAPLLTPYIPNCCKKLQRLVVSDQPVCLGLVAVHGDCGL